MRVRLNRTALFWLSAAGVLLVFGLLVLEKEQTLRYGEEILLRLAPVDPRSFMQGDYMSLDFEIATEVRGAALNTARFRGRCVVARSPDGSAVFVRLDDGSPLTSGEYALHYEVGDFWRSCIRPDSFFFQEGHAEAYEMAQYGVFRCLGSRACLLVGLADDQGRIIIPDTPNADDGP